MHEYVYMCVYTSVLWVFGIGYRDPDPLQEIQSCARYEPNTQAIRKPIYVINFVGISDLVLQSW